MTQLVITPSCTFRTTVKGINNKTIKPKTNACCPKRLKIAEPKNNMSKHETSRDKIACTECILVCFMHNTTKIALDA